MSDPIPFALHGGEKMFYDVRMGPVAVLREDTLTVAYQANAEAAPAHPHIITRNMTTGEWSQPVQIGRVPRYDHHFAPVIWFDHDRRLHALYNCHGQTSDHRVVSRPGVIDEWDQAPIVDDSISYPRVMPMADGRLLHYYRTVGHMGHWGYQLSEDGGFSWSPKRTLVDMDRDPGAGIDCWAGSYHSVQPSRDRRALHIAFVYLDEQRRLNPIYNRRFTTCQTLNRYSLYYLRLDIETGELTTIDGERMTTPVNRGASEKCKVWDTGWRLTNMPSIWVDEDDSPHFLLPVSGTSPWECEFCYVRRVGDRWEPTPVAPTNSTWCGGQLRREPDGSLSAFLASGKEYGELLNYGGGDLEQWTSIDAGATWRQQRVFDVGPDMICNNPCFVERDTGEPVDGLMLFFAWQGPGSLQSAAVARGMKGHRGKAYLWKDGEWL